MIMQKVKEKEAMNVPEIHDQHEVMTQHIPVLLQEVLAGLRCERKGVYLDCTVGCGGHSAAILAQHPENRVLAMDRDTAVLQIAAQRLAPYKERVMLFHQRFEQVEQILAPDERIDGILLDLGVSSLQLEDAQRGFSFQKPGRLDMRMNQENEHAKRTTTAYDVVNTYPLEQLTEIFFRYGEERFSKRIARMIVEARTATPLETTTQLAELASRAVPKRFQVQGIHPATRIFQAIRIEVNGELQRLGETLELMIARLRPGGRCCVISFHSLEDRIVKQTYVKLAKGCQCPPDFPVCMCGIQPSLKILTKKPILPSEEEKNRNPRSRSAKLRIAEKIEYGNFDEKS
ncbi:ribosomal RNA small subunit methyltransferase H [Candidatus Vecturithrix granuli]|uniref:Ribosomal RNA small subunit methyltransferase H n=1 Tax=Vecturithrix granuli TaxID=1499967 RepID=A0A081BU04_VECG1|nr:ribosomal RNA small subunit methyltransferase H [Candidatus Vecturithrix granuli]